MIKRCLLIFLLLGIGAPAAARCRLQHPFPTSEHIFAMAKNVYVAYITGVALNVSEDALRNGPQGRQRIFSPSGSKTLQLVVVETLKGERAERISVQWYRCGSGTDLLGSKVIAYEGVNFTAYERANGWLLEADSKEARPEFTK